jgi:hypothetical protein
VDEGLAAAGFEVLNGAHAEICALGQSQLSQAGLSPRLPQQITKAGIRDCHWRDVHLLARLAGAAAAAYYCLLCRLGDSSLRFGTLSKPSASQAAQAVSLAGGLLQKLARRGLPGEF